MRALSGTSPPEYPFTTAGVLWADRSGVAQDVSCRAFETREVSLPLFRRELLWHITGLHSLNRGYSAFRVSHRLGRLLTGYRQRSSYCHQRSDVFPVHFDGLFAVFDRLSGFVSLIVGIHQ